MKVIEINECPQCPYCRWGEYSLKCHYLGQLYDINMKIIPKDCPLKEQQTEQQYDYHDSQFN